MRFGLCCLWLIIVTTSFGCCQTQSPGRTSCRAKAEPALRHIVLFAFKETSTPEDVQRVVEAFRHLPDQIDGIEAFEWGTDISPEPYSQGLTHAFLLTFDSEADRDAYLPHPAHKAFGEIAGPHIEKVVVVDYWAKP